MRPTIHHWWNVLLEIINTLTYLPLANLMSFSRSTDSPTPQPPQKYLVVWNVTVKDVKVSTKKPHNKLISHLFIHVLFIHTLDEVKSNFNVNLFKMCYLLYGLSFFIFCICSYQAIGLQTEHYNFHEDYCIWSKCWLKYFYNISPPVFLAPHVYIVTQYCTLCSVQCTISVPVLWVCYQDWGSSLGNTMSNTSL